MTDNPLFEVDDTLTVGQITRRLSEAVKRTFSKDVWVQGQIRNLSRSGRGHVYFDLCDPVPSGTQPKASIAVTLFDSNRQIVNRIIKRTGNTVRIDDGVEVRIRAAVEMYVPRGQVQLNMNSIDPEFTLGRLGADRDQLLRDLKAEGLLDANEQVAMPLVPLRVALITSEGSAAHADFAQQIAASGYAFEVSVLSARVQGEFAPEEISDMVVLAGNMDVDVIAIVRGGGARTDLAAFDTPPVARAIASCPKPVLCGIGHEIDTSVADMTAHASLKTPTACAQFLIERVVDFDFQLADRAQRLTEVAMLAPIRHRAAIDARAVRLDTQVASTLATAAETTTVTAAGVERRVNRALVRAEQRLATARGHVTARTTAALTNATRRCDRHTQSLVELPARALRNQHQHLDLFEARVSAVDPAQALQRGYSITTDAGGRLVRRSGAVGVGDILTTRLADGSLTSTVTDTTPPSTDQED